MYETKWPSENTIKRFFELVHADVPVLSPSLFIGEREQIGATIDHYVQRKGIPMDVVDQFEYSPVTKIFLPFGAQVQGEANVAIDLPHNGIPLELRISHDAAYQAKGLAKINPDSLQRGDLYKIPLGRHHLGYVPRSVVESLASYDWTVIDGILSKMFIERAAAIADANQVMAMDQGKVRLTNWEKFKRLMGF